MIRSNLLLVLFAAILAPPASGTAGTVGTMNLDGLSFLSFEGYENLTFPSGSTIRFRFGTANPDGSVPFTIKPGDVSIPPIPLWSSEGTLSYSLAGTARGSMTRTATGLQLTFTATVQATLETSEGGGTYSYTLAFTTETTSASNATGTNTISITGSRLTEGPNYVQLAGATTNRTSAFPEPGRVVYTILSGAIDQLPQVP